MRSGKLEKYLAVVIVFGTVPLAGGCSKKASQKLLPAGSPMAQYIRFEYAVYMMPVPSKDPNAVLQRALKVGFPKLKLVSELPAQPKETLMAARIERDMHGDYAPPSAEALQYFGKGLSQEEAAALQNTREAFILDFAHPKEDVWSELLTTNELVEKIARETGGLVWDEETREVYSPDAWHKRRIGDWKEGVPRISTQTVVHVYENGEFERAISLGMSKVGSPDVVVEELSQMSEDQVASLINEFSQLMAEGYEFREGGRFRLDVREIRDARMRDAELKSLKGNGTGVACLTLHEGKSEDGDPKNKLIELGFERYAGNDRHAKQDAALSWLFGWEDSSAQIENTTGELIRNAGAGGSHATATKAPQPKCTD